MVDTCGHGRIISESNDEETIRECKWFWGVHYLDKMGATQITDICGSRDHQFPRNALRLTITIDSY